MVRGSWSVDAVVRWERPLDGSGLHRAGFKTVLCRPRSGAVRSGACGRGAVRCKYAHGFEELAYFRGFLRCKFGAQCRHEECYFRHGGETTPVQEVEARFGVDVRGEVRRREREEMRAGEGGSWGEKRPREAGVLRRAAREGERVPDARGRAGPDPGPRSSERKRRFDDTAAPQRGGRRGRGSEARAVRGEEMAARDCGVSGGGVGGAWDAGRGSGCARSRGREGPLKRPRGAIESLASAPPLRAGRVHERRPEARGAAESLASAPPLRAGRGPELRPEAEGMSPSNEVGYASPQGATTVSESGPSPSEISPSPHGLQESGRSAVGSEVTAWDSRDSPLSEAAAVASVPAPGGLRAQQESAAVDEGAASAGTSCYDRCNSVIKNDKPAISHALAKSMWCAVCKCVIPGPWNVNDHVPGEKHELEVHRAKEKGTDCSGDCVAAPDANVVDPSEGCTRHPLEKAMCAGHTTGPALEQPTAGSDRAVPIALTKMQEDWLDDPMTLEDWKQLERMADAKGPESALAFKSLRDTLLDTGGVTDDDLRLLTSAHAGVRFTSDARTGDIVLDRGNVPRPEDAASKDESAALSRVQDMLLTSLEPFANCPDDSRDMSVTVEERESESIKNKVSVCHWMYGRLHGHDRSIYLQESTSGEQVCVHAGNGLRKECMHPRSTLRDPVWKRLIPRELAKMVERETQQMIPALEPCDDDEITF